MGKLVSIGKVFECFLNRGASSSCFCLKIEDSSDHKEQPLIPKQTTTLSHLLALKDDQNHALPLHFNPKVVVLRVSMHCNGCARKVEKHISKMEGVDSYKVDLERRMVVVTGDVFPFEVLQSISKVKSADLLES